MAFFNSSSTDFDREMNEVRRLIDLSNTPGGKDLKGLLLGLAVIKIATDMEVFFESIVETFDDILRNKNIKNHLIPESVRFHIVTQKIDEAFIGQVKNRKITAIQTIQYLSALWSPEHDFTGGISSDFDYGKHGSSAVERLFNRVGIEDLFNLIKFFDESDSSMIDQKEEVNIKGLIDSITNYRNKVIHEGEAINITDFQIEKTMKQLSRMSKEVSALAEAHIAKIISSGTTVTA